MNLQVGVKILLKNEAGLFLFLRRSQKFDDTSKKWWDIPGGRIKPEENLHQALHREIAEETGMELDRIEKLIAAQDIFVANKQLHVVRLTYIGYASGTLTLSDEHEAYEWMHRDDIMQDDSVDPYVKDAMRNDR